MSISRNRIALGSYQYHRVPIETFLDTAVELEIPNVELWGGTPHIFLHQMPRSEMKILKDKIQTRGLTPCALTPEVCKYPFSLVSEDERLHQFSLEYFQSAICLAQELECPKVLFCGGSGYWNQAREPFIQRGAEAFSLLAQNAKSRGVSLVLETLTPLSSNLIQTPAQCIEYLDMIGQDNVYTMMDVGQVCYMNQNIDDYRIMGDKMQHVHLHDYGDAIHMALGDGRLNIAEWIDKIESWGYQGIYTLEQNDIRYQYDPVQSDCKSVEYLKAHHIIDDI